MELHLPNLVHKKIMHWVNKTDREVSGFGKLYWDGENKVFTVTDVWLLKQEVGSTHTDIDEVSLAKLMYQTKDMPGDLRFWWHSHVNMPVFWSGTDTETIKKLGGRGWIVASVFNKKEEIRTAFCHKTTWMGLDDTKLVDELPTFILDPDINQEMLNAWDKEFDTNVEVKTYTPTYGTGTLLDTMEREPATKVLGPVPRTYNDSKIDIDWNLEHGILGYGIDEEAEYLKMSVKQYKRIIKDNDFNELTSLENRLSIGENNGWFRGNYGYNY